MTQKHGPRVYYDPEVEYVVLCGTRHERIGYAPKAEVHHQSTPFTWPSPATCSTPTQAWSPGGPSKPTFGRTHQLLLQPPRPRRESIPDAIARRLTDELGIAADRIELMLPNSPTRRPCPTGHGRTRCVPSTAPRSPLGPEPGEPGRGPRHGMGSVGEVPGRSGRRPHECPRGAHSKSNNSARSAPTRSPGRSLRTSDCPKSPESRWKSADQAYHPGRRGQANGHDPDTPRSAIDKALKGDRVQRSG